MSISSNTKDCSLYRRFRASVRQKLSDQERSHKSLASDIGITNVQFSNIMRGKCDPTLSMCCRIAEALGVAAEDLIS